MLSEFPNLLYPRKKKKMKLLRKPPRSLKNPRRLRFIMMPPRRERLTMKPPRKVRYLVKPPRKVRLLKKDSPRLKRDYFKIL
jgi:hypothetical protein